MCCLYIYNVHNCVNLYRDKKICCVYNFNLTLKGKHKVHIIDMLLLVPFFIDLIYDTSLEVKCIVAHCTLLIKHSNRTSSLVHARMLSRCRCQKQ